MKIKKSFFIASLVLISFFHQAYAQSGKMSMEDQRALEKMGFYDDIFAFCSGVLRKSGENMEEKAVRYGERNLVLTGKSLQNDGDILMRRVVNRGKLDTQSIRNEYQQGRLMATDNNTYVSCVRDYNTFFKR